MTKENEKLLLLVGILAAVAIYWQRDNIQEAAIMVKNYVGSRGIRNNNPGNIRNDGTAWQGMSPDQTDASFVQFTTPEYGIRALAIVLQNYKAKYGLDTVTGIISRWAPPSENNTTAYIKAVASDMGVSPDAHLSYPGDLPALVAAIIRHENGTQPYDAQTIDQGIFMASA